MAVFSIGYEGKNGATIYLLFLVGSDGRKEAKLILEKMERLMVDTNNFRIINYSLADLNPLDPVYLTIEFLSMSLLWKQRMSFLIEC